MQIHSKSHGKILCKSFICELEHKGFFKEKRSGLNLDEFQTVVWNVFRMPTF